MHWWTSGKAKATQHAECEAKPERRLQPSASGTMYGTWVKGFSIRTLPHVRLWRHDVVRTEDGRCCRCCSQERPLAPETANIFLSGCWIQTDCAESPTQFLFSDAILFSFLFHTWKTKSIFPFGCGWLLEDSDPKWIWLHFIFNVRVSAISPCLFLSG